MADTNNGFGWFGWFSTLGFLVMGALYLVEAMGTAVWPVSTTVTGVVALIAGLGAALLWIGNDPTRRTRTSERTT